MQLGFGRLLCILGLAGLLNWVPTLTGARAVFPQESASPASLLREAIQLALQNDAEQATRRYYQVLESPLSDSLETVLFTDIKDLLIPSEIASYKSASNKGQWLLRFWHRVDPTPATQANERLVEHYQRLQVARTRYRSPQPRGYDDRGMIYVRYGEPDNVYTSPMGRNTRGNESWGYHRLGDVSFDFVEYGALYRLESDLRRAIESVPQNLRDALDLLAELFLARQSLNIRYQVIANKLDQLRRFRSKDIPVQAALAEANRAILYDYMVRNEERQQALPRHTTDFTVREDRLNLILSFALFAAGESEKEKGDKSRLELYYAIPLQQLHAAEMFAGGSRRDLEMYFSVFTRNYKRVAQVEKAIALDLAAVLSQKDYLGQLTFFLQPDTYRVALDIQSPQTHQRGLIQMQVAVPAFPQDRLSMSDVELASIVRPASPEDREQGFIKNGLYVRPYPYRVLVRQQPIFVYFEIYGLFLNESGTARYRVTYEVEQKRPSGVLALLSALNPFGGQKSSLSLSYEYTTGNRHVPQYTSLDYSGLQPGEYTLVVRVRDLVSGMEGQKGLKIKLIE